MKTDFHLNDVLLLGDSRLYQPCAAIMEHELPELPDIVNAMANVILEFRARYGAGRAIAAPQLGVMKRLVVLNIDRPVAMINPVIKEIKGEAVMEEGCLSIPEVNVNVTRPAVIRVSYTDLNNRPRERKFKELMARVILHENDHLDGKLITDYATAEELKKYAEVLKKLEDLQQKKSG